MKFQESLRKRAAKDKKSSVFHQRSTQKKKRNCPAGEMVTAVHLLVGMINQTFYIKRSKIFLSHTNIEI